MLIKGNKLIKYTMETLTIAIIVITLTVIIFSSFSYSYVSPDPNSQLPIDLLNSTGNVRYGKQLPGKVSQIDTVGNVNPNAPTYALYNLPEKDEYMTADLRNQIDVLRTQYYYDNCQASSFPRAAAPKKMKEGTESFQCTIPTSAQISFTNWNFNTAYT